MLSLLLFFLCQQPASGLLQPLPLTLSYKCDSDPTTCRKLLIKEEDPENFVPTLRLKQITGKGWKQGDHVTLDDAGIADPSTPVIDATTGSAKIYGTGWGYLKWPSLTDFLRGKTPETHPLQLYHPGAVPLLKKPDETPWDTLVHFWKNKDGTQTEVLYAGVMTPRTGTQHAIYPQDNWSRRIYPFVRDAQGRWIRQENPIFGAVPNNMTPSFLGHCYGHDFIEDSEGNTWVFYEKVDADYGGGATRTQIYARKMKDALHADDKEILALGVGSPAYPSTHRENGGYLVEGPRVQLIDMRGKLFYIMGFSAGDFPTDHYGGYIAVATSIEGPYIPLTKNKDLFDLGAEIKQDYHLSWGPARPNFIHEPNSSKWWVIFHAVDKDIQPEQNYSVWPADFSLFYRNLYVAPLDISLDPGGLPHFKIADQYEPYDTPTTQLKIRQSASVPTEP